MSVQRPTKPRSNNNNWYSTASKAAFHFAGVSTLAIWGQQIIVLAMLAINDPKPASGVDIYANLMAKVTPRLWASLMPLASAAAGVVFKKLASSTPERVLERRANEQSESTDALKPLKLKVTLR